MSKKLWLVCILGFSSGVPYALICTTLQAWFAHAGMNIVTTGMLSLLGLPYVYRLLWAPVVDRFTLFSFGKRRSWIVSMQVLLLLGFNLLACLTPQAHAQTMAAIALVMAILSATQDIAIDAHRTEYVASAQHGLAASVAVFGYRLAMLLAGGGAMIFAYYWGWHVAYQICAWMMLPGILVIVWSREPSHPLILTHSGSWSGRISDYRNLFVDPMRELWQRDNIVPLCMFIFLYKLGESFTTTTSGILLPFLMGELGFSLATIAYINQMVGLVAIICGGVVAGVMLLRYSLYHFLMICGVLQAVTNLLFAWLAVVGQQTSCLALAVACDNFIGGMGATALVALMMHCVNQQYTGTQFSVFVAIASLPRVLSGPLAAGLQQLLGWRGLFEFSMLLALLFVPFLMRLKGGFEKS